MRVIVTGSRDWPYRDLITSELQGLLIRARRMNLDTEFTVVEGGCPTGTDDYAAGWATWAGNYYGVKHEQYKADWKTHGKAAGPLRNQEMVDLGADLCLAFSLNKSRGTADCLNRARTAGIPCKVFDLTITEAK